MSNVLADLAIESEAATARACGPARAYEEETRCAGFATPVLPVLGCSGDADAVEAFRVPGLQRLRRGEVRSAASLRAALNGTWEGSGNFRARTGCARGARAEGFARFLAVRARPGRDARLDAHSTPLPAMLAELTSVGRTGIGPRAAR